MFIKNMLICDKIRSKKLLPHTKINYTRLGVPEPEAWKYIIVFAMILGLILLPSMFFSGWEPVPAIAEYPNWLNTLIGACLVVGSALIMAGWWRNTQYVQFKTTKEYKKLVEVGELPKRPATLREKRDANALVKEDPSQSDRVINEIQGHIVLFAGFLGVVLCGLPTAATNIFAFFMGIGAGLGALDRAWNLVTHHFNLVKVVEDRGEPHA